MTDISRRTFIAASAALGLYGIAGHPLLSLAAADTEKRLMVVILRGGMDALAALPPVGDPSYHDARGALRLPDGALLPLNGFFAMHTALKPLQGLYQSGELLALHAAASPYRERSHFEAQDLLENGSAKPHGLSTGWLGRTVAAMGGRVQGLAIGPSVPLVMLGAENIQSWAPSLLPDVDDDFLARIQRLYENDPLLEKALAGAAGMPQVNNGKKIGRGPRQFVDLMKTAADFMAKPGGARLGTVDLGGWDTHASQGTESGRLAQVMTALADGVQSYRAGMGDAWRQTALMVLTEFGRTVAANGSGGSDHGTASAAFLAGGGVKGGRIIGDWPGLAAKNLYEGRDLYPANDIRSLIKGVLAQHLSLSAAMIEQEILPQSGAARPIGGLFV